MRRIGAGAALTVTALVIGAVPAQATPQGQTSLGSVDVTRTGETVQLLPIAQCDVTADQQNSSQGARAGGIASYGSGKTVCTRDVNGKTAKMEASGSTFDFTALVPYGGPRIQLSSYTASCEATDKGTTASFRFSGLSGITAPSPIPANYVATIGPQDAPQAKVTFNEIILANPNDGSVTINMMHIVLYPNGGPLSGDVIVGAAACSPVS
ncbi:MAG: hypothetical protein JOZ47_11030 [Kutzneria sp.]|nr:hypothetical protein [Kutzneria sp.]